VKSPASSRKSSPALQSGNRGKRVARAPKASASSPRKPRSAARTAVRAAALARELQRLEPGATRSSADGQTIYERAVNQAERNLGRRVRAHMPRAKLSVTFTDNRYTMISVRRDPEQRSYRVRLHHMFADAEPSITRALARYVAHNDADASQQLGAYIDAQQHLVRPRTPRARANVVTQGDCFDLQEMFDRLNRDYFNNKIDARISWGPRRKQRRRRNSIKMGSYSVEDRFIRIHRTLDRPFVPRYFVEWIVYHEMLHQVHPAPLVNGRRQFHTPAFLEDEARFERYAEARAWERANIDRLLTY
jgi:hypothetical protein